MKQFNNAVDSSLIAPDSGRQNDRKTNVIPNPQFKSECACPPSAGNLYIDLMKTTNHNYYVYILINWSNKVIYVGVTNNLQRRLYEHKNKLIDGFTKKYNLNKLVYYECISNINDAIQREKQIKKWRRDKKNILVESMNPEWKDLGVEFED